MIVVVRGHRFHYEMQHLAALFFDAAEVRDTVPPGGDYLLTEREPSDDGHVITVTLSLYGGSECARAFVDDADDHEFVMARLAFGLLTQATGRVPPFGILTGVRPLKLMHSMIRAWGEQQAVEHFCDHYLTRPDMAQLLFDCAAVQRSLLHTAPDEFSLYVSIPFCPSRCDYCSFVSSAIAQQGHLMEPYVDKLVDELALLGSIARERHLRLTSIYFGGGTPTAIPAPLLRRVCDAVAREFDVARAREYTIEAGRPDTITREHLDVLRDAGVTRVAVNTQSLNDDVLAHAGRGHTADDFLRAFALVREAGFASINTDLIAGLAGESAERFMQSFERLLALRPDNITIHALTLKRASTLREQGQTDLLARIDEVERMLHGSQSGLEGAGYRPYYLYRQKGTVGGLHNTGWSLPGHEGLYNILIMDERHSILSAGAGGVSKLCEHGTGHIERSFNYKFPKEYIDRFAGIVERTQRIERLLCDMGIGQ